MIFFLGFYNYYLWFVLVKNRNKIIAQKYREIKTFHTLIRNNKNLRKTKNDLWYIIFLFSSYIK